MTTRRLTLLLATATAVTTLTACQLVPATRPAATGAAPPRATVLPSTPFLYPTLPPEWTATWTPTPSRVPPTASASPTARATPAASYSQRLAAAKADITRATNLTNRGQYAAAQALWTQVIPRPPEYADA